MMKKIVWLVVSCLMVISLITVSCGTATPEVEKAAPKADEPKAEEPKAEEPKGEEPEAEVVEEEVVSPEVPRYGGTITVVRPSISSVFDNAVVRAPMTDTSLIPYEQFIYPNWAMGPAGTGEIDWAGVVYKFQGFGPQLAESWEIPEIGTWVMKIREGAHFAFDQNSEASLLVNGREFTADDAVWNVRRYHTDPDFSGGWVRGALPAMSAAVTIEKTGPWEVTLKTPGDPWNGFFWVTWGGASMHMFAPEVIEKYGDANDWRRVVATGPFMLVDFVADSQATYVRNPNYWGKDPVGLGEGNQLPYADGIKLLAIPDTSTRLAAMRTGQTDWVTDIGFEDAQPLLDSNPDLKFNEYIPYGRTVSMRIDNDELPFKDIRVRQALMMATDYQALKNDLFQGKAEIVVHPVPPSYSWLHTPMEELPVAVQKLYKYDPEGAKALLAEAGYPDGFQTSIVVQNILSNVDWVSALKAMWDEIGVDVEILATENTAYQAISSARSWEGMIFSTAGVNTLYTVILALSEYRGAARNWIIKDPYIIEQYDEMQQNVFVNMDRTDEIYRDMVPYIMEQAYVIPIPTPYSYTIWQPWIKNYQGEKASGLLAVDLWPQHVWVDEALKESLGY
ncbi:MAG: ABC transporter substrate-binding protein [Dehalococcoidales bacterium]